MPLPWKKAKGKIFSQLLTNHLAPPKRGASLVVETGFPTSLADLFVKNRNRFNNNNNNNNSNNYTTTTNNNITDMSVNKRKKKKKKNNTSDPIPIPGPSNSHEKIQSPTSLICAPLTPPRLLSIPQTPRDIVVDDWIDSCEALDRDKTNVELVKAKDVYVAVLKMFFVVILALGANKFAFGIALSAFLLFFMEYLGKSFEGSRLFRLLKRHKKAPMEETKLDNSCDSVSEIQILQPISNSVSSIEVIPDLKYEFNVPSGKEKQAMEERVEEVIEPKKQEVCMYQSELLFCDGNTGKDSRRSTIKSKIKKFASKLNNSKKKQNKKKGKESKFDAFGYENAKATSWYNIEREFVDFTSIGDDSDNDQINSEASISPENSSSSNKNNNDVVEDERGRERNSSSGGSLSILVIVLVGLMGSRFLALVYTLSWFFLLKTKLGTRLRYVTSGYL